MFIRCPGFCSIKMLSPLLTVCSVLAICLLSLVSAYTTELSTCASTVSRGSPCFIHCSVTGLQENDYFEVSKVGATYYGLFDKKFEHEMNIGYFNKNIGLNPKLPERYRSSESDNDVFITISGILPEDMGDFLCAIKNENGETVRYSTTESISVTGTPVKQYWERLDESGNTVQRFENDEEITINYGDIPSLALRITINEPLGRWSYYVLNCYDLLLLFPRAMAKWFSLDENTEQKIDSETGLINDFNSSALYYSPTDLPLTPYNKVKFEGFIAFEEPHAPTSTLWLDVRDIPQVQSVHCDHLHVAEIGDTIVFNCWCLANPGPPSSSLKLPGRNERVESGDDEKFDFEVTKSENENTPYRYHLKVTYKNIADEVFGTNKVYAKNQMGESSSFEFTITSAGSKPGLPLLVQVISSLIAIASFASRF